jgi:NADH-quinone oxidoreductase subunit L
LLLALYSGWFLLLEPENVLAYGHIMYRFMETIFLVLDVSFHWDLVAALTTVLVASAVSGVSLWGGLTGNETPLSAVQVVCRSLFLWFAMLLISGSSLLLLLVGWQGMNICLHIQACQSRDWRGKGEVVSGSVGDAIMFLALVLLLVYNHGNVEFESLRKWAAGSSGAAGNVLNVTMISVFILASATSRVPLVLSLFRKSAGFMEEHWRAGIINGVAVAGTGVFLLWRMSFLFVRASIPVLFVALAGLSVLFAGVSWFVNRKVEGGVFYRVARAARRVVDEVLLDRFVVQGPGVVISAAGWIVERMHHPYVRWTAGGLAFGLIVLWVML